MLRALAENHGLSAAGSAHALAGALAAALTDPDHLAQVLAACPPEARDALALLAGEGGRMPAALFQRRFGEIRPFGPGRIDRLQPHRSPASVSETLWYLGLILRTFAETPDGLAEFLSVPAELLPLLPRPSVEGGRFSLAAAAGPPVAAPFDDELLHDVCTLLCFVQAGEARPAGAGKPLSWRSTSLYALCPLMLQPVEPVQLTDARAPGCGPALAFALVSELGWLRGVERTIRLNAAPVQQWLLAMRAQQRCALLDAWRASTVWNDLCRVPGLACQETGGWANDPAATRARLLPLLAQLAAGCWFALHDLATAVKSHAPDFQRPDGDYGSWYIRQRDDPVFLRGFERWDQVEGDLLRFLIEGPLRWLGAVQIGAGGNGQSLFRFSDEGAAWLAGAAASTAECAGRPAVLPDFAVIVPGDAPLMDRFRVARFTTPEGVSRDPSLAFRYRITQTGLRRAARQGIPAQRVLAFLHERCGDSVPANVEAALSGWSG